MKIQTIIHILPTEIDWFEQISVLLKRNSLYLELRPDDIFQINVTLNLNNSIINWDDSLLPKQYFIDKYNEIKKYYDWGCDILFDINEDGMICGINDKRRHAINTYTDVDAFIYLDTDIYFNDYSLTILYQSLLSISDNNEYYIITPQIIKRDSSWDIITHEKFINQEYQYCTKYDHFQLLVDTDSDYSLVELPEIKFGGGWLNIFSGKLLRHIKIPESFGSYGLDDTFIMECSKSLKVKLNIKQFMVKNLIVCENYKYREKILDQYIKLKFDKNKSHIHISETFITELNKVLWKK